MKLAEYVAGILFCKQWKLGEKKLLQFRRYNIFARGLYFYICICRSFMKHLY